MNIAVIIARGGSKRIPRKNIKSFGNKPMIAYAINTARESGLFEHVVVSTDDEEISSIARELGAETPFVRPSDLADDYAITVSVMAHAVDACRNLGWKFKNVCCIYSCVPFLQADDLKNAWMEWEESDASYCFPVAEFPSAVQRALKRSSEGEMQPFYPEYETTRTQDLVKAYFDAGQFYWASKETWLTYKNIHSNGLGYLIPGWRAIDIDLPEDWERAEIIFNSLGR